MSIILYIFCEVDDWFQSCCGGDVRRIDGEQAGGGTGWDTEGSDSTTSICASELTSSTSLCILEMSLFTLVISGGGE